jgi:hypothetical protein
MRPLLLMFFLLSGLAGPLAGQVRTRELSPLLRTQPTVATLLILTVSASTPSSIAIRWSAVAGAAEYRVFHGLSASGPWMPVARVPGGSVTQLDDAGLVPGTTFQYQVNAYADTSGQTLVGQMFGSGTTAAVAPLSVTASCAPSGTLNGEPVSNCTWNWPAAPPAAGYRMHRIYENTYLGTLAKCFTDEQTYDVAEPQYSRGDVTASNATCRHHFDFAALYQMRDFPTPGQVHTVEGPRTTWRP